MKITIVGGGVVGLCCAYELNRAGADVTVVERDRCGDAASRGNAGWVVPPLAAPLPAPGITAQALKMLIKNDGPLRVRPHLNSNFLRWCWKFWRSSSRTRYDAGLKAVLALSRNTMKLYDDLRANGVEFEMHQTGLLIATLSDEKLREYVKLMDAVKHAGYEGEVDVLAGEEIRHLEPALSEAVVGGVHAKDTRHVRPESLVAGLVDYLGENGVRIVDNVRVHGITREGQNGWRVFTSRQDLAADKLIVAAGAWSAKLMASLGVRMPLEAGKGYSVTAVGRGTPPRHPLKLAEVNVACTPFEEGVRVSGIFELGGEGRSVDRRLLDQVVRSTSAYLRDWAVGKPRFEWAGLRPSTPDDLPLIGAVPGFDDLYVATGHGALGVTLAPATGALLAPLVLEGRSYPELDAFGPDRFR